MKRIFSNFYKVMLLMLAVLASVTSCRDNNEDVVDKAAQPEITMVSASIMEDDAGNVSIVDPLEETHIGYANNMYIIVGKGFASLKHVYFNDYESTFNPNLVTDTHIFVTVDADTPYENGSNKLKIVTAFGTAEYDFVIAPPKPVFNSFNPVNAADGEEVTLYGNYFVDPVVKVGDAEAEIVSKSLTEMVIKLPSGSQGKKISVTTLSGTSTWNTAVGTAIFDDKFYSPWDIESWNNHEYVTDQSGAYQGLVYIKKTISAWDNIQGNWNWDEDAVKNYTGIKFAVRSDGEGKLKLVFNGDWGEKHVFSTSSEWTEYEFSWADLGNPSALQNISFQEFSGNATTYYFDNITFTTD